MRRRGLCPSQTDRPSRPEAVERYGHEGRRAKTVGFRRRKDSLSQRGRPHNHHCADAGLASPEQARNEEVTTATDVYGLGAVLYFLLTGKAPHAVSGCSSAEVQRAICEEPPQKPSTLCPELRGDLENILLKALNLAPARRYQSAREMAEDLQRYLSHYPVRATPDGLAYRAQRFVRRHTAASVAMLVAALAIAAGTAISLYQAHRAQQRFSQVRELSNRFIFDFEAAIRDTPGTLQARRMVAFTARQYLSDLSADAGNDPALNRELAQSYYALGV